jgi:hypothetical protein
MTTVSCFRETAGGDGAVENGLTELIRSSPWMMQVLEAVRDGGGPGAWIGAGVLRDLVWGERYGPGFFPERARDVDVASSTPAI